MCVTRFYGIARLYGIARFYGAARLTRVTDFAGFGLRRVGQGSGHSTMT